MNDIGALGEALAAKHLKKNHFKIVEKNIHLSHNEIDIIAIDKKQNSIVFVEVKTRSTSLDINMQYGSPAIAVTKAKQQRIIKGAYDYLSNNIKLQKLQPRFDVIEIYISKEDLTLLKINHIENAFGV